ncbi:hypothetical protein HK101_008849 [Irineochytrium annulatum]|nr:hypothetical protein HK101_008849 [Irineochytrium annulatum]
MFAKAARAARVPKLQPIPGVKRVVAVSSAKGGVGKSTVAVNTAVALQGMGKTVGLLDADVFGPSLPLMMNISGQPDVSTANKLLPLSNYGVKCMSMGFLVPKENAVVWRGLMVMKGIQRLLWEVDWGQLDFLVVDLPPGTGDIQITIAQQVALNGVVVVTTPQEISLSDSTRGIAMFKTMNVPILGVVQNMSLFSCPSCGHQTHIFGRDGAKRLADAFGTKVLADIPLHANVCDGSDSGQPVTLSDPGGLHAKAFKGIAETLCTL